MNDLDGYRRFIDGYASLGYALLFRKLGDFNQAQTALENALVRGHSNWLLERQDPRSCPAFMTKVAETLGTAEAPATAAPVTGLLATSQKLRALGDAVDQLRSFPGDDQVALVLLHVEEVPSEQILRWLGKNPAYLADLELRLKQKLLPGNSQGAASEEPVAFFLRALRQHRLSPQFPELVLQRLKKGLDIGAFPAPLLGWILVIGIPLFLGPLLTQHHGYYEYDYSPAWLLQANVLVQQIALDLIFSLSALLLSRYLRRHAPPGLARELGPWLPRMLWLVAMSGFGLILSELLALLQSTPFRTEGGSIWQFVHAVWLLAAITAVFVGNYRVAVHYLRTTDARTAAGSGGGS